MATEGERMARIEENQKNTNEKLDSIIERFDKFVEKADERYAPAWIAKFVYALIILVISGIIGGAISMLFK